MAATSVAERLHKIAVDAICLETGIGDGTVNHAQANYLLHDLAAQVLEVVTLNARLDGYAGMQRLRGQ
jgi:hypothetical protein